MPAMSATPPPRSQDATILLLHDARAVHDTASIRLRDYMLQGTPGWIAANILPGARSGSGTIPGASIDANTGKLRNPNNAAPELLKEGRWKAVASSSPAQETASGEYAWSEPVGQVKRIPDPEDYYSPFVEGGEILCQPVKGPQGIEQFGPVRLLFTGWGEFVGPAFGFLQSHPSLLSPGVPAPSEVSQLAEVLSGKNPLLALLAFRHLLTAHQLTTRQAQDRLNSSGANLTAGLVYLLITNPSWTIRSVRWWRRSRRLSKTHRRSPSFGRSAWPRTRSGCWISQTRLPWRRRSAWLPL